MSNKTQRSGEKQRRVEVKLHGNSISTVFGRCTAGPLPLLKLDGKNKNLPSADHEVEKGH